MKKNIGIISLVVILLASTMFATPVFAKNLNTASNENRVIYYYGGEAIINLPTDPSLRVNYPNSATMMKIDFLHSEARSCHERSCESLRHCQDYCSMLIRLYMIPAGAQTYSWQPFAAITTSSEAASFEAVFWTGTLLVFTNTKDWHIPGWIDTNNVKLVTHHTLEVERHGNHIYVNLEAPQQLQRPSPGGPTFAIPSFSLELKKYGESFHTSESTVMTGWPGASGYTLNIDTKSFNANGAFTSSAWGYNKVAVSDGTVVAKGIQTYIPPVI
jgi:hypothetical protein